MPIKLALRRLGVGGRLLVAFIGISGFAVVGAGVGVFAFREIGNSVEWITERKLPTALASQQLSRQAEKIVAAAPQLLTVAKPEDQAAIAGKITLEVRQLEALLQAVEKLDVAQKTVSDMASIVAGLKENLTILDNLVSERLRVRDEKKSTLSKLAKSAADAQLLLEPWILVMDAKVAKWRKSAADTGLSEDERREANADLETSLAWFRALQRMRILVATITAGLQQAAVVERSSLLKVASFRLKRSLIEARQLVVGLDPKLRPLMGESLDELEGYVGGKTNIPELRKTELDLSAEAERTLRENADLSQNLTAAVDTLVKDANEGIAVANRDVEAVRGFSIWALALAVALSLICSVLIVWLYVGRNIVARLSALSSSMLAIAGGNLRAPLPDPGDNDEIGQMASALTVFRDTAVEVEQTNLREIEEIRRRLTDAIESISEGFSLYDPEDRLVVCNSTYSKVLYAGIEDIVVPGTPFETIIRTAAERGLIADAVGRIDEWVEERLARHRNPSGSHLQHRGDDSWTLINERKTDDGSVVAVYADITELKQREEELAEKSGALEQLSNQLAKYLSPQVYDSIFSGRQEVKVTSSRKKLTVFFSDIAGFTETADRLESEELTRLLNHYLTEMSRIALEHGATIDKYVGDAILIFFGDPESKGVQEDAIGCVDMAIAMRRRLEELADIWRGEGIEKPLQCRMGIHTGFCTVGNFGSEDRLDYTIIGSAVNIAARLEALAQPGEILISYDTFAHVREQFYCREHGHADVKGIAYPIATYTVVDDYGTLGRERRLFQEEHPTGKIELRLDAMTSDDRAQVLEMLRRAQALINGDPDRPE